MGSGKTHEPKWVLVDFTSVNIEPQPDGSKVIVVKGETPSCSSFGNPVKLEPAAYVVKPDYWRIELLWDRAEAIFQTVEPFEARLNLQGVSGTKGVEIVGRSRAETHSRLEGAENRCALKVRPFLSASYHKYDDVF